MSGAPDLTFVQHDAHRQLLIEEVAHAVRAGALGMLLGGSVARGTARPTSDLDLWFYWPAAQPFEMEERAGILIERHGHTLEGAARETETGDTVLYRWLEAQLLYDPAGALAALKGRAGESLAAYRTPPGECRVLRHWLESTLGKLGDCGEDQIAFLVHTTTWKLAEGLCAVNDRPVPAVTRMWESLPELPRQPEGEWFRDLLRGDLETRHRTFLRVADWVLARL